MAAQEFTVRTVPAQPSRRLHKGDAVITLQEMVEALLWDFAKRAQQDEDDAYQNHRKFIDSSEQIMEAHQERRRIQ
jgi:hypothetical protein